ncbi:hypothetical protein CMV_001826 [Castanea mollissima]|uniref:Uncharacterized protein n=1 Tax=Castanea mollissima TaxID=60419 RepID=A0A8J4S012_9ROSI|nr:hypothetical protein CMV_001826 [Castanea mollissima]
MDIAITIPNASPVNSNTPPLTTPNASHALATPNASHALATPNAPPVNRNTPPLEGWKRKFCLFFCTRVTPNAPPVNRNTPLLEGWKRKFCLFICLVSFLCALGIFTGSQFYAYTIGIDGTYIHIIYYAVGVTLSSAIQVLLIQPGCCNAFLQTCQGSIILKSCGGFFVMFTICFLSSGAGIHYLGLSSYGTAPKPAVADALAPYRLQAFAEIAGLLASALLTVNALSIIIWLRSDKLNNIFEVAATLTLGSATDLLYKYPYVTVAAAVFIMAMTLWKNCLCDNFEANDDIEPRVTSAIEWVVPGELPSFFGSPPCLLFGGLNCLRPGLSPLLDQSPPAVYLFPPTPSSPAFTLPQSQPQPQDDNDDENAVLIMFDATCKHAKEMVRASEEYLSRFASRICLEGYDKSVGGR